MTSSEVVAIQVSNVKDNVAAAEKVDEQVKGNKDNPKVVNDATKTVEGIADDAKKLENDDAKLREKIKQHAEEVVTRRETPPEMTRSSFHPQRKIPRRPLSPPREAGMVRRSSRTTTPSYEKKSSNTRRRSSPARKTPPQRGE